jgi:hypothetical protein
MRTLRRGAALHRVLAIAVVGSTACATPGFSDVHVMIRGTYDLREKRLVWGRALSYFQERSAVVTFADLDAGILASDLQPESCGGTVCDARTGVQFTLADDGVAVLSISRVVRGPMSPIVASELRRECEGALLSIVGPLRPRFDRP